MFNYFQIYQFSIGKNLAAIILEKVMIMFKPFDRPIQISTAPAASVVILSSKVQPPTRRRKIFPDEVNIN